MKFNVAIVPFARDAEEQVNICLETKTKAVTLSLHDYNDKKDYMTEAASLCKQNNIEIVSLHASFYPGTLSSSGEDVRGELIKTILEEMEIFAAFCPGKIVVVHPGEFVEAESQLAEHYEICKGSLKEIFTQAKKLNLKVAVENMRHGDDRPHENFKFRIGEDPEKLVEILNSLNFENTGICFDTGHANIAGDIIERLKACGDKLMHIHISDNFGVRDNHLMPGKGNIDWKAFATTLSALNYKGSIELEIVKPEERESAEVILEARKRLQKFLGELE